jgi:hypothetical protein
LKNKDRNDTLSHCYLPSADIINKCACLLFVSFSLLSSKLTQPHLSMNNMFPPINAHSRPTSEDLHGVSSGAVADIHSASKQQQIRRQQQTVDQQRRSPLRSNSLQTTTSTTNKYVTAAAAVAVPLYSGQFEPAKSELDI